MRDKWRNNFSEWYNDIIEKAEILDIRYPVKGLYVWFPYGFKIRGLVMGSIRRLLEETGHGEALFPLLIPDQEFSKEAKHIRGFENEVYWVTHGGLEPLNVKLALRPTSETAIYPMFAVWIRSHGDMPLRVYQVVNTFRYETKHTRPLIRLREITTFKEAHTAHATREDAEAQVKVAIEVYKKLFDTLGVPYTISRRPDWDKFPGAEYTIAFDTIFPDGRTLQIATVHNLGQNFAKTFDVTFENLKGEQEYVYQTCYGISDRVIASTLVVHGDDAGLCLMPELAPVQVVIVPIWFKGKQEMINKEVDKLKGELRDYRVKVDDRELRPGSKFYDWEIKGVPLRLELGPKDIGEGVVTVVRRDNGEKHRIPRENVAREVGKHLEWMSEDLKARAWKELDEKIAEAGSVGELKDILAEKGGIMRIRWCGE
ncbi:MAG: proline--tRNA ligase, partial [Candidatus Hydrothermarchaeota archaeon]|nr:proline--tRNA ligase [Candidatus Hydrothermarchaeota archaeon]